jgi:hypothetical protein
LHLVHQLDVLLPQGAVLVSSLKNESQWLVGQDLENCCWTTTAALSSDSLARQAVVRFVVAAACLLVGKNRRPTAIHEIM